MNWVLAATLVCGASVFTSCTNDDNPAVEPDLNVAEKIIGKWMVEELDGQPCPTNLKPTSSSMASMLRSLQSKMSISNISRCRRFSLLPTMTCF